MDALGDPELDALHQVGRPSALDEGAHVEAGRSGPGGVLGPFEEHEQSVAAELEHVAAVAVDDLDHPAEALVQQLGELLGTFTAEGGEALGQRREPGDVGRDERSLDLSIGGTVERPSANEIGEVGPDSVRRSFVHQLVLLRHLSVNGVANVASGWSCSGEVSDGPVGPAPL